MPRDSDADDCLYALSDSNIAPNNSKASVAYCDVLHEYETTMRIRSDCNNDARLLVPAD